MGAPNFLRLLERWPSVNALVAASRQDLEAFARACRHDWPDRFAERVESALASDHFVAWDWLVRAKTDTIRPRRHSTPRPRRPAPGVGAADGRTARRRQPSRLQPPSP